MNRARFCSWMLSALYLSGLFGLALESQASPTAPVLVEMQAGLLSLYLPLKGFIRLYYAPGTTDRLQAISYSDAHGLALATQEWNYPSSEAPVSHRRLKQAQGFWSYQASDIHYSYSPQGLVQEVRQHFGAFERVFRYDYDESDKLIQCQHLHGAFGFTKLKEKLVPRYSLDGKQEAFCIYDSKQTPLYTQECEFDTEGRLVLKREFEKGLEKLTRYDLEPTCYQEKGYEKPSNQVRYRLIERVYEIAKEPALRQQGTPFQRAGSVTPLKPQESSWEPLIPLQTMALHDNVQWVLDKQWEDALGLLVGTTQYFYGSDRQLLGYVQLDRSGAIRASMQIFFDDQGRPFLYEYSYDTPELLKAQLTPYLHLPF